MGGRQHRPPNLSEFVSPFRARGFVGRTGAWPSSGGRTPRGGSTPPPGARCRPPAPRAPHPVLKRAVGRRGRLTGGGAWGPLPNRVGWGGDSPLDKSQPPPPKRPSSAPPPPQPSRCGRTRGADVGGAVPEAEEAADERLAVLHAVAQNRDHRCGPWRPPLTMATTTWCRNV